ncbi:hypothetical protein GJT89_00220 [Enterobacteriaceae endosymbiont of Donacia versicolorea]|uniref:DJ-1/PfpI family protein n=1 Tax=Enterobacteriaceae endosymbiont of Donacia versicolorea TaxID=2675788 RepID=UPI001448B97F|nr:DJ-1/PfpI family protein [Enterobacteriaceae endosymbiont of Donacia versicolorea]QJC31924.1 hypothetical protein GJT89_00220 [Enterobacteriaceae endosymbiont of Donacia versicolorea]
MTKNYSVFLCVTDGVEDIETVSSIDILTRSNINVILVSTNNKYKISCAHGTNIISNIFLKELKDDLNIKAILLPGGLKASKHFSKNLLLLKYLKKFKKTKRIIGAICASPAIVIASNNIFPTAKMTGYLNFKSLIPKYQWSKYPIFWDDKHKLLTAQSVKYAIEFNLKLVKIILGEKISLKIEREL